MKALVTGATGFIGGALAEALLRAGWQVNLLVRPASRHKLLPSTERAAVFEADLSQDVPHLHQAVEGCQVVFHAAAIRDRWGTSQEVYRQTNVEGTRRLLQASLGRVRRFVYISSVGVFGHPGVLGIDESFPLDPQAGKVGYHSTKAEAEGLVQAAEGQIETVVVRPTITYGPGDQDGMLTRLIGLISQGKFVRVGRGDNHLHLTYIDDLLHGLLLAAGHPVAPGQVFILAGPESIAFRDLVAIIESRLGRRVPGVWISERLARWAAWGLELLYRAASIQSPPPLTRDKIDTLCVHRSFSHARAARLLGYQPRVGYAEGLEKTLEWMAARGDFKILPGRPAARSAHSGEGF